jgi:RNA polymerase sigma-70 factor (ECF subfamily)
MKTTLSPEITQAPGEFEELIKAVRPELHRYAARMIGSVIDGEDVVQETVLKAYSALPALREDVNLRGWLFRIAHNQAIDHLRRRNLQTMEPLDENFVAETGDAPLEKKESAAIALSVFLRLAPRQRSCVILKDVLGYSLAEIAALLGSSVPEIKAVLHRGRTRLREFGKTLETVKPVLDAKAQKLLTRYIDRFNARDFEAVRRMLTDEARLDLVNKAKLDGAAAIANNYFHNYSRITDWHLKAGIVENRPAILVFDPQTPSAPPDYFILLTWDGEQVSAIRDYRYARYAMEAAGIIGV